MNLRWPATAENDLRPWYQILVGALVSPAFYAGKVLCWLSIAVVDGPRTANLWWSESW